jgi:hypothetical protein
MAIGNGMPAVFKTAVTDSSTTPEEPLGAIRFDLDHATGACKMYKYVQAASDTTVAYGTPLAFSDLYGATVTSDISDASQNQPAGVGVGAIAASSYGWIQVHGHHDAIITNGDDDIADGDTIILSSADGQVDSVAAGTASTHKPLAIAVDADVDGSNTVEGFICVM